VVAPAGSRRACHPSGPARRSRPSHLRTPAVPNWGWAPLPPQGAAGRSRTTGGPNPRAPAALSPHASAACSQVWNRNLPAARRAPRAAPASRRQPCRRCAKALESRRGGLEPPTPWRVLPPAFVISSERGRTARRPRAAGFRAESTRVCRSRSRTFSSASPRISSTLSPGTITSPSRSPTIQSPHATAPQPPHDDRDPSPWASSSPARDAVLRRHVASEDGELPRAGCSRPSRVPPSITAPAQPRDASDVAESSPKCAEARSFVW